MEFWSDFWSVMWFFFWSFVFISYLFAMFAVIADLFRDHTLNGWLKAVWILFLIFVPFLTVLVYLIARGKSMAERNVANAKQAQDATNDYIRTVAHTSPAEDIAKAKGLLDSGAITAEEYASLKAKALA